MDIPSLSKPASSKLLFHVSDPIPISCSHGERKPNVMLITEKAARDAGNPDHINDIWEDIIYLTSTKSPHKSFHWETSMMACKFKKGTSMKLKWSTYQLKPPTEHEPISSSDDELFDTREVPITQDLGLIEDVSESSSAPGMNISPVTLSKSKGNQSKTSASGSSAPTTTSPRRSGRLSRNQDNPLTSPSAQPSSHNDGPETLPKKWKQCHLELKPSVNVQATLYGAEHLAHLDDHLSVMTMVIIGSVIRMWWYDRQGAIQTYGINFVEVLPYYVVLLILLQRLPGEG
ncbi:hypothetical protein FRC03_005773 [Tulasnella sp. 419]|nr:hypothetical protein FRC02_004849 [Tulasnella sp. 418]KAG8940119.1 hypothetical protein FRC03_005773 [Tulasnella sp. 419]